MTKALYTPIVITTANNQIQAKGAAGDAYVTYSIAAGTYATMTEVLYALQAAMAVPGYTFRCYLSVDATTGDPRVNIIKWTGVSTGFVSGVGVNSILPTLGCTNTATALPKVGTSMPDGVFFFDAPSVDDNVVTYDLTPGSIGMTGGADCRRYGQVYDRELQFISLTETEYLQVLEMYGSVLTNVLPGSSVWAMYYEEYYEIPSTYGYSTTWSDRFMKYLPKAGSLVGSRTYEKPQPVKKSINLTLREVGRY